MKPGKIGVLFCLAVLATLFFIQGPEPLNGQSGSRGSVGGGSRSSGRAGGVSGSRGSSSSRNRFRQRTNGYRQSSSVANTSFALVELFTSEGCSSCPPADKLLQKIDQIAEQRKLKVYTVSYHVDYWDHLGWKDPFAAKWATERQQSYRRRFRSKNIYTPQMVVNGTIPFVGSNEKQATQAINEVLKQAPLGKLRVTSGLSTREQTPTVEIKIDVSGNQTTDQIVLILVQKSAEQKVAAGENSGKQLSHIHVARQLQAFNPNQKKTAEFRIPRGSKKEDFEILAFLQAPSTGQVKAATTSLISTR